MPAMWHFVKPLLAVKERCSAENLIFASGGTCDALFFVLLLYLLISSLSVGVVYKHSIFNSIRSVRLYGLNLWLYMFIYVYIPALNVISQN